MRLELKYATSKSNIKEILDDLKNVFKTENYKNDIAYYENKNIYYDTSDFIYYRDKVEGYSLREKFRIRLSKFMDNPQYTRHQIEIKSRRGFVSAKKYFTIHNINNFDFYNINTYLENNYEVYLKHKLLPIITVRYDRQSLSSNLYKDIRFTVDNNIIASKFNKNLNNFDKGFYILEPKYSLIELKMKRKLPLIFKNLIKKYNLKQITYSKYSNSVETIYEKNFQ